MLQATEVSKRIWQPLIITQLKEKTLLFSFPQDSNETTLGIFETKSTQNNRVIWTYCLPSFTDENANSNSLATNRQRKKEQTIAAYFSANVFRNTEKCTIDLPPSDLDCCKTSHSCFICQKSSELLGIFLATLRTQKRWGVLPEDSWKFLNNFHLLDATFAHYLRTIQCDFKLIKDDEDGERCLRSYCCCCISFLPTDFFFTTVLKKNQKSDLVSTEVYDIIHPLKNSLQQRADKIFFGHK